MFLIGRVGRPGLLGRTDIVGTLPAMKGHQSAGHKTDVNHQTKPDQAGSIHPQIPPFGSSGKCPPNESADAAQDIRPADSGQPAQRPDKDRPSGRNPDT